MNTKTTIKISLAMPEDLKTQVYWVARRQGTTPSEFIRRVLDNAVDEYNKEEAAALRLAIAQARLQVSDTTGR
jgi:metal-responsive CopG/Arc/MetJ family transcriptional regulator